ncbi:MAG TPA: class I SAM-dependent methyltransferase [Chloroflexia bacterium]|nr:class I SAM-dependent methyltransferase [Chloroflexia bacterium]
MAESLVSQAGAGWSQFYQAGTLSWVAPLSVDAAYLDRMARSEWIVRLLELAGLGAPAGQHILEAGCGVGLYALALSRLGFRVAAFDYNPQAVDLAERIRERVGLPAAQVSFTVDNLLAIQAPDSCYDLVFNQAVLEYFCDERELDQALEEMIRVLAPGRKLVLIVQNTRHPLRGIKRMLGWRGFENQPPVRSISAGDLQRRLRARGLVQVQVDGIDPWKGLFHGIPVFTRTRAAHTLTYLAHRGLQRLVPLPRAIRSRLAVQFIVAGQKPTA